MQPMVNYLSEGKCPQKKPKCDTHNPCKKGNCVDGLKGPNCYCPEGYIGQFCETGEISFLAVNNSLQN